MLAKKRGGLNKTRRMAKKNAPAALQTEVSTDEEWSKIMERKGLIVVDVYSDWSGPCTGMVSILKKIKMEIGGDLLSYATAKCDNITDLERFRGKSEPTWMFIHNGKMVNLMFGAYCPELQKMLTDEIQKVKNNEPHEFCIGVNETSPEEENRLKVLEKERLAKEIAKKEKKEAQIKARYEAELHHFMTCLNNQTCLILYPWVFKDEEGHKRDKKSSLPYVDLIENILPEHYTVEQELRKHLNQDLVSKIFIESNWEITSDIQQLLMDGKCMFMRVKMIRNNIDSSVEKYLLNLLFVLQNVTINRHLYQSYQDKTDVTPIIVFKFDSTRKNELKVVLEMQESEVIHFGIFERDKPPEAKLIATNIDEYEEKVVEKTGYEAFVCVVKKIGSEAFLTFAGIGPYHVSENPDIAIEESKLYFPDVILADDQSDDEEKPEDSDGRGGEQFNEIADQQLS
ncbi:uncharacterized protein LOC130671581 isoform X5 [Microplitis mediator]|uniref:uncharacterized protein LOC130671581 isoform X5 n=1 Tax=Microplitis mediator TaxID=375433 RepID=UPI00255674C2|nr:uncharacterized protein LOC130671581 isoform X5 [Microplitis mediator]